MIEAFRRVAGLARSARRAEAGDRPLRVLLLHAHPDDETLATGALIVALVKAGVECTVVTATRGEMGEVTPGPYAALAGTDDLVAVREGELGRACAALGVAGHAYLGRPPARAPGLGRRDYRDSGMRWVTPTLAGPSTEADARSLTAAEFDDVVADVRAAVAAYRPDVVVTYDAGGGYGHPDHVRMHDATLGALSLLVVTGSPPVPLLEVLGAADVVTASRGADEAAWFDLPDTLPVVQAALRCHGTQLTVDDAEVVHVGGQREPILTAFGLARVPVVGDH